MDALQTKDIGELKTLAICHYVLAGFSAIFASLFLIHVAMGIGMVLHPEWFKSAGDSASPPQFMGYIFAAIGGVVVLSGWCYAVLLAYAGKCLNSHQKRRFCFVMAVLSCMSAPLGTVLGVFTIIVLNRPSVQALFEGSLVLTDTNAPQAVPEQTLEDLDEDQWRALEKRSNDSAKASEDVGEAISLEQTQNRDAT